MSANGNSLECPECGSNNISLTKRGEKLPRGQLMQFVLGALQEPQHMIVKVTCDSCDYDVVRTITVE